MKLITSSISIVIATLVVIQSYLNEASSECIVHSYWAPVCGNNNVTYVNAGHLECIKRTVPGLEKWYDGECIANPIITTTTTTERPSYETCRAAARRKIYSPICGSDRKTYENKEQLKCETQYRSIGVRKLYNGRCRTSTTISNKSKKRHG